jgi:23S rRNA (cytidine1920-2'-O)/16S rRNA (cytidine1409-2'-O)-methyltransferase
MVRRGLAGSRSEAAQAIRSGKVVVAGRPVAKTGTLVSPDEPVTLATPARRFASRGGEKLDSALTRFGIEAAGRHALDAGASTGGFTDCLLSRGVGHVIAVDVGYGQLDWRLREDPRVTVLERTSVRDLRPEALPYLPDLVVADLSFISLTLAVPPLVQCSAPEAEFVLLVKPQFEAGREAVGSGGVVSDPEVWRNVLASVSEALADEGLGTRNAMASPLIGPAGNVEFFLHATRNMADESVAPEGRAVAPPAGGSDGTDFGSAIGEGIVLRKSGRARKPDAKEEATGGG